MITELVAAFGRITAAIVALRSQVLNLAGVNFSDTMPSAAIYRWWMPPTGVLHVSDGESWAVVPGRRGPAGRAAQFQANATHIQWRHVGDTAWTDLLPLTALVGPSGAGAWLERRLVATQALVNDTSMQDWFTSEGGLPLGANSTYEFEATFFSLNGATSHGLNMQFAAIAGGAIQWNASGVKVVAATQATAARGVATNTFNTSRNVTTASTVAGNMVFVWGTVRTGAGGGTLRPQVAQSAASGSFVAQAGTYFKARRVGTDALVNSGGWA